MSLGSKCKVPGPSGGFLEEVVVVVGGEVAEVETLDEIFATC